MDFIKKLLKLLCKTVPEPDKRNLQLVYTPQDDEGMENFSFLMSTLYPLNGQTDFTPIPLMK
ncbi:MAG: hypothetical protein PWQ96_1557 [Clostridia bacterium]|jgi:hypothetical protein|nr:hypothetical protein [Clostridiales bacterium]MDK2985914.1 hypothetical protein [Clostridia bacterium]